MENGNEDEEAILLISEVGDDIVVSISPKGFEMDPAGWGSLLYNIVVQLVSGYVEDKHDPLEVRKKILGAFDEDRMKSFLAGEVDTSGQEH